MHTESRLYCSTYARTQNNALRVWFATAFTQAFRSQVRTSEALRRTYGLDMTCTDDVTLVLTQFIVEHTMVSKSHTRHSLKKLGGHPYMVRPHSCSSQRIVSVLSCKCCAYTVLALCCVIEGAQVFDVGRWLRTRMGLEARAVGDTAPPSTIEFFREKFGQGLFRALEYVYQQVTSMHPDEHPDMYRSNSPS